MRAKACQALDDVLHDAARTHPDKVGLIFEGARFAYGDLDRRASAAAARLAAVGVETGDRVAVLARNSPAYVDLLFGASRAAAVFTPLKARLAGPEIAYIVADAEAKVLVLDPALAAQAQGDLHLGRHRPPQGGDAEARRLRPLLRSRYAGDPARRGHARRRRGAERDADGWLRSGDPVEAVKELTLGGVYYAFKAIGLKTTIEQAFQMLRRGGTATMIGIPPMGTKIEIDPLDLVFDSRLQGSQMGSNRFPIDMPRFVDMYLQGRLKLDEPIPRRIRLEDINSTFTELQSGSVARSVIQFPM